MSIESDVTVVGAGPTGSFSALKAAKLGAKVTICEEHNVVGAPSHCTGHVSIGGLERFKLNLPRNVFENEIRSAVFYSPSGYRFSVRFANPVTCVLNRGLLDKHLSELAEDAGVKLLRGTHADSFLVDKDQVKGVLCRIGGKRERLLSNIVIDAEGVFSTLLKRANLLSRNNQKLVRGVQADVDRVDYIDDNTVEVFLGRSFASGFFAWIVPRDNGTAKVGLATDKGKPKECLQRFIKHNPVARQKLNRSRITNLVYHPISLGGPISRTYWNGLIAVGDTASQIKPTTGGGVIMGLTCAELAGETAGLAIKSQDSKATFLSRYERRWRKKIDFDMKAMKHLRRMLNSFSDKQLDRLIGFCQDLKLNEALKEAKDVDFQGTSLIRLARNPKIFRASMYLAFLGLCSCAKSL